MLTLELSALRHCPQSTVANTRLLRLAGHFAVKAENYLAADFGSRSGCGCTVSFHLSDG